MEISETLAGLSSPTLQSPKSSHMSVTTFTKYNDPRSPTDTISSDKSADNARRHIDGEVQRLEDSIRSLKSRRNALAPISRLPPEILSKIFIFCASAMANPGPGKPLNWIKVSHISRYWRAVALDCPSLWGNIVTTRPRWTEEMLKRSKMASLSLDADLSCVTPKISEAVQLALHHISRIRDLRLIASSVTIEKLITDLPIDAPFLHSLSLSIPRSNRFGMDDDFTLPESLFSGDTSQLRQLELMKCNINWNSPLLTSLTVLKICDTSALARPTISQLLDTLEKMPALEVLHLQEALPAVSDETTPPYFPDRVINLSNLSYIHVSSTVPECANLLKRISIPTDVTYNLNTRGTEATNHDFSSIFNSFADARSSGLTAETGSKGLGKPIHTLHIQFVNPVSLVVQGWASGAPKGITWGSNKPHPASGWWGPPQSGVTLGSNKPQFELNLSWRQHGTVAVESVMIGVCKTLALTKLKSLRLSHLSDIKQETWATLFGTLPRLQTIQLKGKSADTFISALGEEPAFDGNPPLTPTGSRGFLTARRPGLRRRKSAIPPVCFPDLRTLTLEDADFDDNVGKSTLSVQSFMDCLMDRAEKKAEIQELRLTECNHLVEGDVNMLKEIVADVDWDGLEIGCSGDEMDEDSDGYGYGLDDMDADMFDYLDEFEPSYGFGGYESPFGFADF